MIPLPRPAATSTGHVDEMATGRRPVSGSVTLLRPDGTRFPARPSPAAGFPAPGRRPSTATTTSGSPTLQCRTVRSRNSAARAPRTARRASRPAIRFRLRAATSAADCRCRPTSPSVRQADVWVMNNWQDIDSCFGSPEGGALDPLRWPGRHDLLRHGQAGSRAADRACTRVRVTKWWGGETTPSIQPDEA